MQRLRLTGLFLFITTLCIGMAAAATRTTHIRFKRSDRVIAAEQGLDSQAISPEQIQFMSVPIVYPLLGCGMFGLLLWFVPGGSTAKRNSSRRRSSKSRKSSWLPNGRRRSTR